MKQHIFFFTICTILLAIVACRIQQGLQSTNQQAEFHSMAQHAEVSSAPPAAIVWVSPYEKDFAQNRSMAAWLRIDGTVVNYPVMQTLSSPDYYLHHDLEGRDSKYGVPYFQFNCSLDKSDNIIIYGHSMKDGTMFADLLKYSSKSYWAAHPEIRLFTRTENRKYRILGVFRESVSRNLKDVFKYWDFVNAKNSEDYSQYFLRVKSLSLYDTGEKASRGEQLLTLSTCEYTLDDGRLAVVAKRVS